MGKRKKAETRAAKRRTPTLAPVPYEGDHGTGTRAALAGTILEPLTTDDGKPDPNRRARRRRIEVIDHLTFLDLRQWQAAREIRDAYCMAEKLSSGAPLKERVDTWPNADAITAAQVDAYSRLKRAMDGVPRHMRPIVEAVCWHNTPITRLPVDYQVARSIMQGAMTCVANKLRY